MSWRRDEHDDDLPAWEARLTPFARWLIVAIYGVAFGLVMAAVYIIGTS